MTTARLSESQMSALALPHDLSGCAKNPRRANWTTMARGNTQFDIPDENDLGRCALIAPRLSPIVLAHDTPQHSQHLTA